MSLKLQNSYSSLASINFSIPSTQYIFMKNIKQQVFPEKLTLQASVSCTRYLQKIDILNVPSDKTKECLNHLLDIYEPFKPKPNQFLMP